MIKSEEEWEKELTPEEFRVLRKHGTESAFSGEYHAKKDKGKYLCAGCGKELFDSETKFDSGTGWPSFYDFVKNKSNDGKTRDSVETSKDFKMILPRTEVHCKNCGGHLGHVFNDGPQPTGKRYCINSVSLKFGKS